MICANYEENNQEYPRLWKIFDEAVSRAKPIGYSRKREMLSFVINGLWDLYDQELIVDMSGIPRKGDVDLRNTSKRDLNNLITEIRERFFPDFGLEEAA